MSFGLADWKWRNLASQVLAHRWCYEVKGGQAALRSAIQEKVSFHLEHTPLDICCSIQIGARCSVLVGLQESWGGRKLAPTTGRQMCKSRKSSLYRGAASLAVPQLKVPESHCLLKATETCFQLLIKCNNSFATRVLRNFISELVCIALNIVIAGGGFKWSHIVLLGLKVHTTLNCIPIYGTLYVRRIVSPTRQSSIRKVARA